MRLEDLRIDIYRNAVEVTARVIHLPTGLSAASDPEKSVLEAKRVALLRLQNALYSEVPTWGRKAEQLLTGQFDE